MTGTFLDLAAWPRRRHYEFYRQYDQPFFGLTSEVCVSTVYRRTSAAGGPSFFLTTLFESLHAANQIEALKLRLRPDGVWRHEIIHGGSTILRPDSTFGFGYFEFISDFDEFHRRGRQIIAEIAASDALEPMDERDDLIHYSVLPWIRFTSVAHARNSNALDSVPKIVFGKRFEREGDWWMPVSVEVHHALADGLHVAHFLEAFQAGLDRH